MFDPGGTTGWVYAKVEKGQPFELVEAEQAQFTPRDLYSLCDRLRPEHVVAESFAFRQGKQRPKVVLISRDLLGVLNLWCDQHDVPLTLQRPADAKPYATDAKLRALDLWFVGAEHARDAARHFIWWLTFGPGFKHAPPGW